jgi:hypothetical protein
LSATYEARLNYRLFDVPGNVYAGGYNVWSAGNSNNANNYLCVTNLLGIKGAGEAGTIGACPAVMNAVIDALWRAYGIREIDMPATPALVWQAIQEAKKAKAA